MPLPQYGIGVTPTCLPTGFGNARDIAGERKLPEMEPAHLELAQIAACAAANAAAVPMADFELGFPDQLRHH
jgi:hypothetical protein